jgi:preprotein translocase subunit SecG
METINRILYNLTYLWIGLLALASLFLIILVLLQRGRGGGLTGALGGMGGQSAFGAKAGDVFTRITVVVASIWIALCLVLFYAYSHAPGRLPGGGERLSAPSQPVEE